MFWDLFENKYLSHTDKLQQGIPILSTYGSSLFAPHPYYSMPQCLAFLFFVPKIPENLHYSLVCVVKIRIQNLRKIANTHQIPWSV